jgi:hypothetical protein
MTPVPQMRESEMWEQASPALVAWIAWRNKQTRKRTPSDKICTENFAPKGPTN